MLHDLQGGNNYFGEYHFALYHSGLDTSPGSDPHSWHAHCQNLETLSIFFLLKKPGKFLQDRVVIAVVLALAGIDVILCSVWTIGFKFYTIRRERFTDDNIIQAKVNCFLRTTTPGF